MVRGRGEQHLAMAQRAAQHAHLVGGTEGPGEQPLGVQALQPLAIEPIGFRPARDMRGLAGIAQEHLHATRFEELKEGNPVDAGRCQRDGGDATVNEPVGQGVEVSRAGAETTHGLGGAPWRHGDPVLGFADVDARGMGVADLEGCGEPR